MTEDSADQPLIMHSTPEQMSELIVQTKPVFERAIDLITRRGWGRRAYARDWMNRRVTSGVTLKAVHHGFSIGGAIILAAIEEGKRRTLADEETSRVFQQSVDTMISVIYASDIVEGDIKLLPLGHRIQMAMQIIGTGQSLPTVCGWNDVVVRDKAHALTALRKALQMTSESLEKLRAADAPSGRLQ